MARVRQMIEKMKVQNFMMEVKMWSLDSECSHYGRHEVLSLGRTVHEWQRCSGESEGKG